MLGFWPILGGLVLASLGLSVIAIRRDKPLSWTFCRPVPLPATGKPRFETLLDYVAESGQSHSPTIQIGPDEFTLLWFQGSKEAQADVDIHGQSFCKKGSGWKINGSPGPILTRTNLGEAFEPSQLVVTLGNVVQNDTTPSGSFATVVSLGGWAMASIAAISMRQKHVANVHKLNLSPLLGRSHLVKSPMVAYNDGSHGLPAYYEVKHVFSELVRFDETGRVRDKRKMTRGQPAIQPMIVPLDENRAIALMRSYSAKKKRQLILFTENGGRTWQERPDCGLPNPQAPLAALNLGDGRILIAFNDHETRSDLFRLAISDDEGHSWRRIHTLEDGNGDQELACRYPMMRVLHGGDILLAYSVGNKRGVRAHLFNLAWVNAQ